MIKNDRITVMNEGMRAWRFGWSTRCQLTGRQFFIKRVEHIAFHRLHGDRIALFIEITSYKNSGLNIFIKDIIHNHAGLGRLT